MKLRTALAAIFAAVVLLVVPSSPASADPIPVSACQTITAPGTYTLTADISQSSPGTGDQQFDCMSVRSDGVTLDCGGHVIGSWAYSLEAHSSANLVVSNCYMTNQVRVNGLTTAGFSGNTLTAVFTAQASSGVTVQNNSFIDDAALQTQQVSNSLVDTNTFSATGALKSAQISENTGNGNTFSNNTLDGGGSPAIGGTQGFDDGIILENIANDVVTGNHISNVWDAAIEGGDLVTGSQFNNNIINNVEVGVGSYWWSSWQNNTVSQNTIGSVGLAFYFINDQGAPYPYTVVYFTGNQFLNNTVTSYTPASTQSAAWNLQLMPPFSDNRNNQPRTDPETLVVDQNTYTGNNFATVNFAPGFAAQEQLADGTWVNVATATSFINGGGNVCGPWPSSYEPICTVTPPTTTTTSTTTTTVPPTTTTTTTTTTVPPTTTTIPLPTTTTSFINPYCHGKKHC